MDVALGGGVLLAGAIIGALLAWLFMRARTSDAVEASVAQAQASVQIELVQVRERLRSAEQEFQSAKAAHAELQQRANTWRDELDRTKNEQARLIERLSRVPALEAEVARLTEELSLRVDQIRQLSASEAQKAQEAASLAEGTERLQSSLSNASAKLESTAFELQQANERRAALEELAARVPLLEGQLANSLFQLKEVTAQLAELRETSSGENSRLAAELSAGRQASDLLRAELADVRAARSNAEGEVSRLSEALAELRTRADAERQNSEEKLQLLLQAREALTNQFKSLAADILEEKSKRFVAQNQASLGELLDPFKTKLAEFRGKVEEVYFQEAKDRTALAEQVRQLFQMNQTLSADAKNLTEALRGSAKTQGNWGELILERVLESSGLRKDHEYVVQDSRVREDGSRAQPDVVINLPEERKLIVDSKVSLVAYERYVVAGTEGERAEAARRHLDSVRVHIKSLSEKRYHELYGIKSLDFVMAFVPIEPAFMLAVASDADLFMDAWKRNVLLVSPSTLLFVVRTVAHLWRQEAQSKNAQDIAKRGAELYDKLCSFVEDLHAVGKNITQAQRAYEAAHSKLATGRGNVIRQADLLRQLGVKPNKMLPAPLLESATQEDEVVDGVVVGLSVTTGEPSSGST